MRKFYFDSIQMSPYCKNKPLLVIFSSLCNVLFNLGHKKLQGLRSQVLSELRKQNPDFKIARELIGQFLHIVQMFYSNTNWCDYNGNSMYPAIGMCT